MSGHSKWSTIKRQKQATDIKRGKAFTKISRAITIAVRESGGIADSASNFKLRLAVEKAREVNMPKENIQRAIDKGSGKGDDGQMIESVIYEGYAPHGVALIIDAATENKQRTGSQIKHILERGGGHMGGTGSVMFLFDQQGLIFLPKDSYSEDQILEQVVEAGALDMQVVFDGYEIYTAYDQLHIIKEKLVTRGFSITSSELVYRPKTTILIDSLAYAKSIISCIELLEELDDVQRVFANDDMSDAIVKEVSSA